uniref:Condensation domain-containing protein n=1 Tax=viral metagenome TaxID=1070528 RepID=A0A6C0EIQ3_9ZZZZ
MLSYSQVRIALLHLYYKNIPIYNISFDLNVEGDINIKLLEKSLNYLLYRFPDLKTNVEIKNDTLVKKYNDGKIKINVYDNENIEENQIKEKMFNNTYLDIEQELLVKVLYLKKVNKIVFLFSDIIIDGVAIILFCNNLADIYNSLYYKIPITNVFLKDNPSIIPSENTIDFWKDILPNDCTTYLKVKENNDSFEEDRVRFSIEGGEYNSVKLFLKLNSVTLFNYFTSIFLLVLHLISGQNELTIDTVMGTNTDNIGLYNNTVLIPLTFSEKVLNLSKRDYIKYVETLLNTIKNNIISLEYLTNKVELNSLPNIRIHFEYANKNIDRYIDLGKAKLSSNSTENTVNTIRQLLIFNICEFDNKVECYFSYKKDAFNLDNINAIIKLFKSLLLGDNNTTIHKIIDTELETIENITENYVLYKNNIDKRLISYKLAGKYPDIKISDFKKQLDRLN